MRSIEECSPVVESTLEEPGNMEVNETPAPISDMASSDATTSDGFLSLVPESPSLENITE
ncbi:unnamed protein product, partial [Ilex paraguariensis]